MPCPPSIPFPPRRHSALPRFAVLFLIAIAAQRATAEDKRPIAVDDLFQFTRVADPRISPDGSQAAYVATTVDLAENSTSSTLWLVDIATGSARQLTNTEHHDRHPRFSPDGRRVLFESDRSGETQLWLIDTDGGEAHQLTTLASGASQGIWSSDGAEIAFVSSVYPELSSLPFAESDKAHRERKEKLEKDPVRARVVTDLLYRHWDSWVEGKRQHLFVVSAAGGEPRDLTPGDRDAVPTSSTFSAGDEFTFGPEAEYLVYTAPPAQDASWSTNHDLMRVPIGGGKPEPLTSANAAADGCPRFSPDGEYLAYRAQKRPGFEADRWELIVAHLDGSNPKSVTAEFDHSIDDFVWAADSNSLLFVSQVRGTSPIFRVTLDDLKISPVIEGGSHSGLSISRDGRRLVFSRSSMTAPAEVFTAELASSSPPESRPLTTLNRELLSQLDLPQPESVEVPGAEGQPMQMWIVRPPRFDAAKRWPLVYMVHGGPQGAWDDSWSYRWNPEVWAAQGYVVVLPNPRGSTSFGQQYTDEVSRDWGGRCFADLMAGIDWLEKQPYVDRDRLAAAGASFGGYMMNWFEGHTDRFRTLISHCGVYNLDSMYGTTEELWFVEWDLGGAPWQNGEHYHAFSPHRFAKNFRTPMLIIQNDLDYRVPVSEGLQLFTALRRQGVPAKLINFPDEGHWVLKPANSRFWHEQIFAWLAQYAPPGPR